MSIRPCSMCRRRVPGKLCSAYWAWFTADGERVAWKQKLCQACLLSHFQVILRSASSASMDGLMCPGCGGTSETDLDPVFLILYLPKSDPREFELNTDAACAAKIRVSIVDHGDRLENRELESRGPSTPSNDPWAELEL